MQPKLAQAVVAAVTDLHRARLRERVADDHLLRVEFEGALAGPSPVWARIEEDGGLAMTAGDRGLEALRHPGAMPQEGYELWWTGLRTWGTLEPAQRSLLEDAGVRARREQPVPFAHHFDADRLDPPPRRLPAAHARRIVAAIRGLLAAVEAGALALVDAREATELPVLTLSGSPTRPDWSVRHEPVDDDLRGRLTVPLGGEGLLGLDEALESSGFEDDDLPLERLSDRLGTDLDLDPDVQWVAVGRLTLAGPTRGDAFKIVLFLEGDEVHSSHMLSDDDPSALLASLCAGDSRFAQAFERRLPGSFLIHDRWVLSVLSDQLEELGCRVRFDPHEQLDTCQAMRTAQRGLAKALSAPPLVSIEDRTPDTAEQWLRGLAELVLRFIETRGFIAAQAHMARAFVDPSEGLRVVETASRRDDAGFFASFTGWGFFDVRADPDARTECERSLDRDPLTTVEQTLLEAFSRAPIGLCRLLGPTADGGSTELEDVVFGERHTVDTSAGLAAFEPGTVLPMRLATVGPHTLPFAAGPQLDAELLELVLDDLRRAGALASPERLRAASHRLLHAYTLADADPE